jgi:glyoxylase-like metal-dependent hydrolase (beta-lactamase superfamily II)
MEMLAGGISFLDLKFQARPRVIATVVLQGTGGVTLIDPGPSSTLGVLRSELGAAGIRLSDVTALLLTHIHLDHAGASGTIVADNPRVRVVVHENGAPHLVDPAKLLASATRLYGSEMEILWGEVRAVPASAIVALGGTTSINLSGHHLQAVHTPGHASHHVCYFCAEPGLAFVGDTAGICIPPSDLVLAPTPPPDIDIEAWETSLDLVEQWRPDTLFLTHFGPQAPVEPHLAQMRHQLIRMKELARASLERDESDEARQRWFEEQLRQDLRARESDETAQTYQAAGRFDLSWRGLARYWRKRS